MNKENREKKEGRKKENREEKKEYTIRKVHMIKQFAKDEYRQNIREKSNTSKKGKL